MCKRLMAVMLTVGLMFVLCGCGEQHVAVWGLAGSNLDSPDNEYTLRAGLCDHQVEAGVESSYIGVGGLNQSYGAYALYHLEGDSKSLLGKPYLGYHASVGDSEDGSIYGPVIGTVYWEIFVVEVQPFQSYSGRLADLLNDENDEHKIFTGVKIEF
ncbi:hypothetical protein LCGC14_1592780 [marine sediment metagenome]|uniref:Outer membrane protein beta-barrel domain-containing protein n=1 Tax=marine sediment metagenome TaxID=412755 RepID=A0A0F9LDZ2_9ZZZZ